MSQEEKSTGSENSEPTKDAEGVEEAKGLSRRDALEVAIAATKDDTPTEKAEAPKEAAPQKEVKRSPKEPKSDDRLEPPAEYTNDEKEDFRQLSRKGQEAQLRLDKSRRSRHDEIRSAAAELQWSRDLVKELEPYLKSVGEKMPAHQALTLALKMRNEFENGDPKAAAAAYLKAKGIEVPKELLEGAKDDGKLDEKISPLRNELNEVKTRLAQKEQAEAGAILSRVWSEFEQEKNAAGATKYPDLGNDEAGLRLASTIGSLVGGKHPDSQGFFAYIKARIPNATTPRVLQEAYTWCGGRIAELPETRTQDTQSTKAHILKSQRAASSTPGRGGSGTASGPVKKYKTRREALEAAVNELRERDGL